MFSGICKAAAWWKAPLSSTMILNSDGVCCERSLMNSWKVWLLQWGISSKKWCPVMGEKAPSKYRLSNRCRYGAMGLIPLAVIILLKTVSNPKRLSSSKYRLILLHPLCWNLSWSPCNFWNRFFHWQIRTPKCYCSLWEWCWNSIRLFRCNIYTICRQLERWFKERNWSHLPIGHTIKFTDNAGC